MYRKCLTIEDIIRHGALDYYCFMYERKVKYKQQTTDNKYESMCKTFADREAQLQFVTCSHSQLMCSQKNQCCYEFHQVKQQ